MIKEAIERYKAPTPMIYEVAGDIILILSVALDGVLIATEVDYKWIIVNSVLGALGKILLRMAKVYAPVTDNKDQEI